MTLSVRSGYAPENFRGRDCKFTMPPNRLHISDDVIWSQYRLDVILLHYPTQTPVLLSGSRLDRQWFVR